MKQVTVTFSLTEVQQRQMTELIDHLNSKPNVGQPWNEESMLFVYGFMWSIEFQKMVLEKRKGVR